MFSAEEIMTEFEESARILPPKLKVGDRLHDYRFRMKLQSVYKARAARQVRAARVSIVIEHIPCVTSETCECGGTLELRPGNKKRFHIGGKKGCSKR